MDAERKRHLYCWIFLPQYEQDQKKKKWRTDIYIFCSILFSFSFFAEKGNFFVPFLSVTVGVSCISGEGMIII